MSVITMSGTGTTPKIVEKMIVTTLDQIVIVMRDTVRIVIVIMSAPLPDTLLPVNTTEVILLLLNPGMIHETGIIVLPPQDPQRDHAGAPVLQREDGINSGCAMKYLYHWKVVPDNNKQYCCFPKQQGQEDLSKSVNYQ